MNRIYIIIACFWISSFCQITAARRVLNVVQSTGDTTHMEMARVDSIFFSNDARTMFISASDQNIYTYPSALIHSISSQKVEETNIATLVWVGSDSVRINNPYRGVIITHNKGHVTVIDSTQHEDELNYYLSGISNEGSITVFSLHNFTLHLYDLTLVNPSGPVINSQSEEIMTIMVPVGSTAHLSDSSLYQNPNENIGTVFSKGAIAVSGGGNLYIKGLYEHAISSHKYLSLRVGNINLSANKDAIHAIDSISLKEANITAIAGQNGMYSKSSIILHEGDFICNVNGNASCGIKSEEDILIRAPRIDINQSGNYNLSSSGGVFCYAIKAKTSVDINDRAQINIKSSAIGGQGITAHTIKISSQASFVNIEMSGNGAVIQNVDTSIVACLNADGNIYLTNGTITLKSTGHYGTQAIATNAQLFIGHENTTNGPNIIANTSGKAISPNNSNNLDMQYYSSAINAKESIAMYSGNVDVKTEGISGIGLCCQTAITLKGGYLFIHAQQDNAISANGIINLNGAFVYACSDSSNTISSTYEGEGAITISDGAVIALSSAKSPKEVFHMYDISALKLNGGYLFVAGGSSGSQGNPQQDTPSGDIQTDISINATQPYGLYQQKYSLNADRNYAVMDQNDNVVLFFKTIVRVQSDLSIISAPTLQANKKYKVCAVYGYPTNYTEKWSNYLYIGGKTECNGELIKFTTK